MNMFEYLSVFIRNLMGKFRSTSARSFMGGTIRRRYRKRGRNEPCWCRSGKKYKLCHWREDYLADRV